MNFHRLGVKFFVADSTPIRLNDFIPIFHGWIQKQNLPGHLLIDVHDYSHIHNGPGILLVAHEGNFSIDTADGRPGLFYYRKAPTALEPAEHIATILKAALQASRLLEKDGHIRVSMDDFVVVANDRLNAANNDEAFAELRTPLAAALKQVFEREFQLTRALQDPKDRLTVRVAAT
jgi:hypothetical protein